MTKSIQGGKLAGGNPERGRVENDFYATPEIATVSLMEKENFPDTVWEPACGDGRMSEVLKKYNNVLSSDLINRGYSIGSIDFLMCNDKMSVVKSIITNPPFKYFQEFAEKCISLEVEKFALFGKIQALEGQKRATFLESSPLKKVYVFKKRINPLRNGLATDENGKPWASTMCFAWYVWEKDFNGNPGIEWV